MYLTRFFFSSFCTTQTSKHHHKITQLVKRMTTAQETFSKQQEDIKLLQEKLKLNEQTNRKRNNQVHQMRVRLTQDIQKAEQIWADARKQIDKNKSQAIQSFAKGLVQLGKQLNNTSALEKKQHSVELKQGFQLTTRLFFTTLAKYGVKMTELKEGDQVRKGQFEKIEEEKTDKAQLKGKIARVTEQGWEVEGKLTILPKVVLYA